jgi:hypothetical protein
MDEEFTLPPNPSSLAPSLLVASATPDGRYVATELEDAQGAYTLSLAPTSEATSQITLTPGPPVSEITTNLSEAVGIVGRLPAVLIGDSLSSAASATVAASEQDIPSFAPASHGSALAQDAVPAAFAMTIPATATSASVPLFGVTFHVVGVSAATGIPLWQHLTDPFILALARTAITLTDPAIPARDYSQVLLSVPFLDNPDEAGDEIGTAWDYQREWSLGIDQHARTLRAAETALPAWEIAEALDQISLDLASLDEAFSQTYHFDE